MALLHKIKDIAIIELTEKDNRFNNNTVKILNSILDEIENDKEINALVTYGRGKIFSNGLDLEWLLSKNENVNRVEFIASYQKLMNRFLTFSIPTIAAMNGHAFAGGCMFALCHDFRIMNNKRGYICMPEVDLQMTLTNGMNEILKTKISDKSILRDVIILGKRYTANDALKYKFIDRAVEPHKVLGVSIQIAAQFALKNYDRNTFHGLKKNLYSDASEALIGNNTGYDELKSKL
eukprot:TRINITY_DN11060_c0_g1_i1.p1 TRINITY_DN11060_c0_g1~~TRINITY_DN11060_c0_g1_i1.p1  ORF type:complete len:235 (+),score=52.26 TRINITY_DN11060_c0_g1_i1:44-748(+)